MKKLKHLADCPHCGVPIYWRERDTLGIPQPLYACTCRFMSATPSAPAVYPMPNTNPSWPPTYPYYPTWYWHQPGSTAVPPIDKIDFTYRAVDTRWA